MTEHRKEWSELRVGAAVILRDWKGDTLEGIAFLSPAGEWFARATSGACFPVMPRELVAVRNGASETWARLHDGAAVTFADWQGDMVKGKARRNRAGIWEVKDAAGARWLLEPYRLASIQEA
jgi:hypothetical protein